MAQAGGKRVVGRSVRLGARCLLGAVGGLIAAMAYFPAHNLVSGSDSTTADLAMLAIAEVGLGVVVVWGAAMHPHPWTGAGVILLLGGSLATAAADSTGTRLVGLAIAAFGIGYLSLALADRTKPSRVL